MEVWKRVVINNQVLDYEVSDLGRVKRRLYGKILKERKIAGGYSNVCLGHKGVIYRISIHRLVALTFLGPPLKKNLVVHHKDENPANNNVTNLEYLSPIRNTVDYYDRREIKRTLKVQRQKEHLEEIRQQLKVKTNIIVNAMFKN